VHDAKAVLAMHLRGDGPVRITTGAAEGEIEPMVMRLR
jgi:hypothetical protein